MKTILKLAISSGLVAWLVVEADMTALRDALIKIDLVGAAAVVLLLFSLIGIQAWRWAIVARSLGVMFAWRAAWVITLIGAFFNQVLPSSVGGDAARVWRLQRAGLHIGVAINTVLVDRLVALLGTIVIVTGGLPLLLGWIDGTQLKWAVVTVVAAGTGGLAALLLVTRYAAGARSAKSRAVRAVDQLGRDARTVMLSRRVLAPTLLLSLGIHTGVAVSVWTLAASVDVDLALVEAVFLVPLVILFSMIPITIAGWGVREGAMVVALGTVGVPREEALAVSLLFGLATACASLPGGVVWLATRSGVRADGDSNALARSSWKPERLS